MKINEEVLSDETLEKLELYKLVKNDKATASELMRLSYLTGVVTKAQYDDYLEIEETYAD